MSPRAINAGLFRLQVGVDVGAVAAGFEQRETYRVLAGQECAAGEAAAIAGDSITLAVALDVEVIGRADKFRDKSGHCDYGVCFMTPNKSYCPRKPSSSILAGSYKNIIEDNAACEVSSSETLGRFRDEAGFRCDRNSTRSSAMAQCPTRFRHLYWCRVRSRSKFYRGGTCYADVMKQDAVITMARFRTLSACPNAMISATQCRWARALLGWSITKLASSASVSASAIDDFEAERRAPMPAVAGPIRRAFEPVGVVFLPGEDVRLRSGAQFEVGGDSARVHMRQTRRRLAA